MYYRVYPPAATVQGLLLGSSAAAAAYNDCSDSSSPYIIIHTLETDLLVLLLSIAAMRTLLLFPALWHA